MIVSALTSAIMALNAVMAIALLLVLVRWRR